MIGNPYDPPTATGEALPTAPNRLSAFRDGSIRGSLWSSVVALFGGIGIYGEYSIGLVNQYDPITKTSSRVALSYGDILYCLAAAAVTVLLMVVLPWACTAGCVHMLRHGKPANIDSDA